MKYLFRTAIFAGLALAVSGVASAAPQHALARTASISLSGIKKTAGAVLFGVEEGVDAVHLATAGANKALLAAAPSKITIPLQKAVGFVDEYVGKADTGLEKAEATLFGSSN